MKRTVVCLVAIFVFIITVVLADLVFMTGYAKGFNRRLDDLERAQTTEELHRVSQDLHAFFKGRDFWAHRFVPTNRLEDLEMLLLKLSAYIDTEDEHEVRATTAEIRARVNLLYSTDFYRWYQKFA